MRIRVKLQAYSNLNFKLGSGGEAIGLWDASQVDVDHLTYGPQTTDISYGRFPDGTNVWGFMTNITPGAANVTPDPPTVNLVINEFMASNDFAFPGPQGDYPDWIEIYNLGIDSVNLAGYFMSDDLVDPEARFQISDAYPDSVTVEPGGYIVFLCQQRRFEQCNEPEF